MIDRYFTSQLLLDEKHLRDNYIYINKIREIGIDKFSPNELISLDIKLLELLFGNYNHHELFNNIDFLNYFKNFIKWDFLSCDKRIIWDYNKISKFKDLLCFSLVFDETFERCNYDFIQRCFFNNGQPCGLSMSPHLTNDIITQFIDLWDWDCLSSNPCINIDINFINFYFKNISFWGLSQNKSLSYQTLLAIKTLHLSIISESTYPSFEYNNINRYWNFNWYDIFENSLIVWDLENIKEFLEILNNNRLFGRDNWKGISKNLNNKDLILKYSKEIDFFTLANLNPNILWDIELTGILISKDISLETTTCELGLSDLLEKIKIDRAAIIYHKEFWFTEYTFSFSRRTSDGVEKEYINQYLWTCLKDNKNIIWDEELQNIFEKSNKV